MENIKSIVWMKGISRLIRVVVMKAVTEGKTKAQTSGIVRNMVAEIVVGMELEREIQTKLVETFYWVFKYTWDKASEKRDEELH